MTLMEADDEELDRLYRVAYTAALRILLDVGDAQDCAQEATARALVRWRTVRPYADPWVVRVSINLAVSMLRRRNRVVLGVPVDDASTVDGHEELVSTGVDMQAALRRLPARQREAVVMRYLAGLSETDVAASMRCSAGTVKTHTRRGLASLRKHLRLEEG